MRPIEKFAWVVALCGVLLLAVTIRLAAQSKPKYDPTEVQSLRLQVKQKDAIIAGQQLNAAQAAYNNAVAALVTESKHIITEQKWPESTQFDINNSTFCDKMVQGANGQMVCPAPGQEAKK